MGKKKNKGPLTFETTAYTLPSFIGTSAVAVALGVAIVVSTVLGVYGLLVLEPNLPQAELQAAIEGPVQLLVVPVLGIIPELGVIWMVTALRIRKREGWHVIFNDNDVFLPGNGLLRRSGRTLAYRDIHAVEMLNYGRVVKVSWQGGSAKYGRDFFCAGKSDRFAKALGERVDRAHS